MIKETGDNVIGRWLVSNLWSLIVAIAVLGALFGERVESPERKIARIESAIRPTTALCEEIHDSLDRHMQSPGHQEAIARIVNLEKNVGEIRTDVKELLRRVKNGV